MPATIIARTGNAFTIQVEIPYGSSMLDAEEALQQRLNEAGTLATAEILQRFDTDGSPIQVGETKLTSKGKLLKEYQTPYGVAPVERHVYQGPRGGKPYCPLDRNARIVGQGNGILSHVLNRTFSRYSSLKAHFSRLVSIPRRHSVSRFSNPRTNRRITLTFAAAWPVRTRDSSSRKLTSSCQCS